MHFVVPPARAFFAPRDFVPIDPVCREVLLWAHCPKGPGEMQPDFRKEQLGATTCYTLPSREEPVAD